MPHVLAFVLMSILGQAPAFADQIAPQRTVDGQTPRALNRFVRLMDIRPAKPDFSLVYVNGHPLELKPASADLKLSFEVLGTGGVDHANPLVLLRKTLFGEDLLILAVYRRQSHRLKLLGFSSQTVNLDEMPASLPAPARLTAVTNWPLFKLLTTRSQFEYSRAFDEVSAFLCPRDDLSKLATLQADLSVLHGLGVGGELPKTRVAALERDLFYWTPFAVVPSMLTCGGYSLIAVFRDDWMKLFRAVAEGQLNRVADRL